MHLIRISVSAVRKIILESNATQRYEKNFRRKFTFQSEEIYTLLFANDWTL